MDSDPNLDPDPDLDLDQILPNIMDPDPNLMYLDQCCRSKYIEFGSGSRILGQFGSGSRVIIQFRRKNFKIILEANVL